MLDDNRTVNKTDSGYAMATDIIQRTNTQVRRRADVAGAIQAHGGIDSILDMLAQGETYAAIARSLGVDVRSLWYAVTGSASPEDIALARELSAEAWADKGWQSLQMVGEELTSASVNRARYLEQHCLRRAAVANARYSEKQSVELTGANGGPIQSQAQVIVYLPDNGRDVKTIDAEDVGQTTE